MGECIITLGVNAGLAVEFGGAKLLIDPYHSMKSDRYSRVTPERLELIRQTEAFQNPDIVFFTHCHGDHFDRDMTLAELGEDSGAVLALPEERFEKQLLLTGDSMKYELGGLELEFVRLAHSGAGLKNVIQYGLVVSDGESRVFFTGDAGREGNDFSKILKGKAPDLAVVSFFWALLPDWRACLDKEIKPKRVLVNHLPLPEDNKLRFADRASAAAVRLMTPFDIRIQRRFPQREVFHL